MPVRYGSSPRLWGTQTSTHPPHTLPRFIPTPVGNTMYQAVTGSDETVHPHACGEHNYFPVDLNNIFGSSPRLWGTPLKCVCIQALMRFIPTPVGNTPLPPLSLLRLPVHPHACGEHSIGIPAYSLIAGSSPRLWGTPWLITQIAFGLRFIPTPVGNTLSS